MAGTYVEPHTPALGAVDPASVSHAEAVHEAAVGAALELREHYAQQSLGQGSQAGDPMPAEPTQWPVRPNSQPDYPDPGNVSSL